MVRSRKTTREIILWMEENLITLHGNKFAAEVVVHTLLEIGSKSFTHLITVMERYGQVIAKLASDVGMQVLVINEVTSFLKNNTQMIAIAIDRMMGYRLVSNLAIVTWVFSEVNVNQFHLSDRPWEILQNAINKTYNRISNLRKKIRSLEKGILLAQKTSMKAQKEYEAVELKFEIVDGQLVQAENPRRLKRLKGYADRAKHEETGRESLNAKEALLARALEENMELFISLYKRIRFVFMECFPSFSPDGKLPSLRGGQMDIMIVDLKKLLNMDVDDEKGNTNNSNMSDSERAANAYKIEELEQWCLTIMGYVKSISRQYSKEIWPHMEVLDAEFFNYEIHPLFRTAVYEGLGRSIIEPR